MRAPLPICILAATTLFAHMANADFAAGQAAYERGAYEEALAQWLPLAEAGDADAQASVGVIYRLGNGVPVNIPVGEEWFARSRDQGNVRGALFLASSAYARAHEEAEKQRACELHLDAMSYEGIIDYPRAYFAVGRCYYFGHLKGEDGYRGIDYIRYAAHREYPKAQFAMGYSYMYGEGLPKDLDKAYTWMSLAYEGGYEDALQLKVLLLNSLDPAKAAIGNALRWKPSPEILANPPSP